MPPQMIDIKTLVARWLDGSGSVKAGGSREAKATFFGRLFSGAREE